MGRALPLSGQRRHCLGKTAPWGRQSFSLSLSSLCSSHSGFIISVQGPCRAQALPVNWRGAPRAARLGVIIIALRARKVHVYMTMLASPARFLARELALRGALPRPSAPKARWPPHAERRGGRGRRRGAPAARDLTPRRRPRRQAAPAPPRGARRAHHSGETKVPLLPPARLVAAPPLRAGGGT